MFSSVSFRVLAVVVFALRVAGDYVDTLPECWQDCVGDNSKCSTLKCLCNASNDGDFLPNTVACARSSCDSQDWQAYSIILSSLESGCSDLNRDISESAISSAEYVATSTSKDSQPTSTARQQTQSSHRHTASGNDVTKSTGSRSTSSSTDDDSTSSTETLSTVTLSPSPAASSPTPTTTAAQQHTASSSSSSRKPSQTSSSNNNNNGSPFQNMQAGASTWTVSGGVLGIGLLLGALLRL